MPFQSEKQRRYLWANEPEIARDWTDTYGSRIRRDNGGIMDWADQGGMKNYLGEQPMVNAPQKWRAGPNTPPTELAYVTGPEKELILRSNMHGSLANGPNEGPSGIMSLDTQGDYTPDMSGRGGGAGSGGGGGGSPGQMAANEAKRKAILTGQVTTGQTQAVSDRVRQGAVPEYARGPGGKMKYIGSAYKSPGQTGGWLSRLFGGQNKYGYAPTYTKGIQFNPNRGRLDRQGEYQFTDPRTGNIKPGWGGRILGGLAGLATGIPFVGGAIGSAIDKGKGIFGKQPRDMSQFNRLGLYGKPGLEDFQRQEYYTRDKTPMDRIDPWTNQGIGTLYDDYNYPGMDTPAISKRVANEEFERDNINWEEQDTIIGDKTPYEGMATQAAFVKDKFLQEQPFMKDKLDFQREKKYNLTSYTLGSSELQSLYKDLRSPDMTVGKLLNELKTGKYDKLPAKITDQLKEHVLGKVDFGDTFQENWSMGVVEPTFKGNRLDIEEGDLEVDEMKVKPSDVLEMGVAEGGRIFKALGGKSRDI